MQMFLICGQMSKLKSQKNTFGWVRAEVLGALVNSVFLIGLCFTICVEAIQRLTHSHHIEHVDALLYVGIAGLVINVLGLFLLHEHGHAHGHGHGHKHRHGYHGADAKNKTEQHVQGNSTLSYANKATQNNIQ